MQLQWSGNGWKQGRNMISHVYVKTSVTRYFSLHGASGRCSHKYGQQPLNRLATLIVKLNIIWSALFRVRNFSLPRTLGSTMVTLCALVTGLPCTPLLRLRYAVGSCRHIQR